MSEGSSVRKSGPRIPPLSVGERDAQSQDLLRALHRPADEKDLNIFTTLVRHPELLRKWAGFGGVMLNRGTLGGRDRELLILRTARNCQCHYEWNQHRLKARELGVSDAELGQVGAKSSLNDVSEADRDLLTAADELHVSARIGDDTWARLASRYNEMQLIEICLLVGQYHAAAYTLNSLDVEAEPWHQDVEWT